MLVVIDTCSYRLNKEDVIVSELFELLESVRDQIGIMDWGIKMTTLEDGMFILLPDCLYCQFMSFYFFVQFF